jgi:hypothetical protein
MFSLPEWFVHTIIALSQLLTIEKSRVRLAPEGHLKFFFLFFLFNLDDAFALISEQAKRAKTLN